MTSVTKSPAKTQRQSKQRFCKLSHLDGQTLLTIRQQQGKTETVDAYTVEPIVSEMGGRALLLHKHDGTSYSVLLDGNDSRCDCLGNARWGHRQPCKHIAAGLALQSAGKLS